MTNHDLMHQARRKALAGVTVGLCGFALLMMHGGVVSADTVTNNTQTTATTAQVTNVQNNALTANQTTTNAQSAAANTNSAATANAHSTATTSASSTATTSTSSATNAGSVVSASASSATTRSAVPATQAYVRAAAAPTTAATNLPSGQEYGYLDNVSYANGTLHVSGWNTLSWSSSQMANVNLHHYLIVYDRTQNKQLAVKEITNVARPDVQKVYPNLYNDANSGFSADFTIDSSAWLNDVIVIVSRYSTYGSGNGDDGNTAHYTDWWSPSFYANQNNFGWVDSVSYNGSSVSVSGWHATTNSYSEPNRYLIIWDQTKGIQLASVKLSSSQTPTRTDVGDKYTGVYNSNRSGFNVTFNTSSFSTQNYLGDTIQFVSRYSSSANGNGGDGQYTDYWSSPYTFTQHAYYIDSINNKSNGPLTISGWMASQLSNTATHAYVIVLGNGREIGRQEVNLTTRSDVKKAYPLLLNSGKSGFSVTFNNINPSQYSTLQVVLRFTSDPAGNIAGYTYDDVAYATYNNSTGNVHLSRGAIGVDVSSYQGTDLSTYARNGAQYAIVKLTEGTNYHNPNAAGQIASAKANNMVVMAYHFAHFYGSVSEAQAEANFFLRDATSLPKGSILVLDDEGSFSSSQSANTQAAIAFMQVIKNAGYVPYFYTSSSMGRNQVNIYTIESSFPNSYWVAAYPNGTSATTSPDFTYFPSNPGVVMWQFTSNWRGLGVDASVVTLPIDLTLA